MKIILYISHVSFEFLVDRTKIVIIRLDLCIILAILIIGSRVFLECNDKCID